MTDRDALAAARRHALAAQANLEALVRQPMDVAERIAYARAQAEVGLLLLRLGEYGPLVVDAPAEKVPA